MKSGIRLRTFLLGLFFLAAGCGNGTDGGGTHNLPSSVVQVKLGDAPADRVVSLKITVDSITLTSSGGGTVPVLSTPTAVELTHRAGIVEPLNTASVPQDMYVSATISVSSPEVKIVDDAGQVFDRIESLTTSSTTVSLNPTLVVSGSPLVLNLDFDMDAALQFSGTDVVITPTFIVTASPVASESAQQVEDGKIEDLKGTVTGVSGSSFTVGVEQAAGTMTFATDSGTQFEAPLTGVGSLSPGLIVEVEAVTRADGTLLATQVEAEDAAIDLEVEGLISQVTGAPATSFQLVVQDTTADGSTMPDLGNIVTVNLSGTAFRIDDDDVDLSNLPFATLFSENTLSQAQRVEVDADVPDTLTIAADKVKLKKQALTGTVTSVSAPSGGQVVFTLSLPAESYLVLLTGQSTLTVVQQPSTELRDISSVNVFQTVRVRGLLFFNGTTFNMVASRIDMP